MTARDPRTDPRPDILIFFRMFEDGMHFYVIEAPATADEAAKHAELNPGTLRVEDINGNILWRPQ